jgi:hypothetical protein
MRCLFNLYERCQYHEETKQIPNTDICSLCIKAYRLRKGLVTILRTEGQRTGVTL